MLLDAVAYIKPVCNGWKVGYLWLLSFGNGKSPAVPSVSGFLWDKGRVHIFFPERQRYLHDAPLEEKKPDFREMIRVLCSFQATANDDGQVTPLLV